jgi:hypothetical protein
LALGEDYEQGSDRLSELTISRLAVQFFTQIQNIYFLTEETSREIPTRKELGANE